MVGKAKAKLSRVRDTKTFRLTIPASLASDTSFPFEEGGTLAIEIDGDKLIVKKSK